MGGPQAQRDRPLVFVDDLTTPELSDADLHHFERVLRLPPGEPITLGDGAGRSCPARFAARPEVTGPVVTTPDPGPRLTVAFAPVKAERPEWVVQKLTELGVDRMVPVVTARSVVRWSGARRQKVLGRMNDVAREACLQARRLTLPVIEAPMTLGDFLTREPDAALADPDGSPPTRAEQTVVIGPEGGFDRAELRGRRSVALPGAVLRSETAAVVAGAVLIALRSGLLEASRPAGPVVTSRG